MATLVQTDNAADTDTDMTNVGVEEMDTASKQGWQFFTKFLMGNVVMTIIGLLVVALLTVWS